MACVLCGKSAKENHHIVRQSLTKGRHNSLTVKLCKRCHDLLHSSENNNRYLSRIKRWVSTSLKR